MAIPDAGPGGPRRCVYTVLTGGYERLTEQPMAHRSALPFLCLTDDPTLRSDSWKIRLVEPCLPMDPVRSQRALKLLPHRHLPDVDVSLYIDNSVVLTAPPEDLFAQLAPGQGMALPAHSFRDSLLDEFLEVSRLGYDDQGRLFEQLNHYQIACPEALAQPPPWTAILLRDHRDARVRRAMELWLAHVLRYSRRDQLSAGIAFAQAGLAPQRLPLDNFLSDFHAWPRAEARRPRAPAQSLAPPAARLRALEQALAESQAAVAAVEARLARHEAEAGRQQAALAQSLQGETATSAGLLAEAARLQAALAGAQAEADAARQQAMAGTQAAGTRLAQARAAAERADLARAEAKAAQAALQAVLGSTSWRLLAPLQAWLARHPRLLAGLRRARRREDPAAARPAQ
ncbi:glycosyltransferase domain-containing protein [Roseomonas sp. 18066]|uniref:glycosyltransferase domain-containing protein n=1 Tax=Roseomonas sp. 18066 TaxID=2681412 RepID=UPI00135B5EE3|nr:glycosyltransferase domain-containing protein [Roseomonas sp. 18066]